MAFWRRKEPRPPTVSCFGKLRTTGDFIRLNASGNENTAFDQWLGGSINLAQQSLGASFEQMYAPALGIFIYRGHEGAGGEEPGRGMIGVWGASGDSAGRRYPMVVSASYDYEQLLAVGPGLPIAVWPFLTAAYDLVANGRDLGVDDFVGRVAQLRAPSLDDPVAAAAPYQRWLRQQQMGALWATAFGGTEMRHAVVSGVRATIELFRGKELPHTALALHFPIGAGDAYAVAVWTDMTVRLAGWERTVLNAFWTPQHDLMLHIGPPQVGTFGEMLTCSGEAEHVMDFVQPSRADPQLARQQLGATAAVVDDLQASIWSFLQAL